MTAPKRKTLRDHCPSGTSLPHREPDTIYLNGVALREALRRKARSLEAVKRFFEDAKEEIAYAFQYGVKLPTIEIAQHRHGPGMQEMTAHGNWNAKIAPITEPDHEYFDVWEKFLKWLKREGLTGHLDYNSCEAVGQYWHSLKVSVVPKGD